jgi:hypothetical protein
MQGEELNMITLDVCQNVWLVVCDRRLHAAAELRKQAAGWCCCPEFAGSCLRKLSSEQ